MKIKQCPYCGNNPEITIYEGIAKDYIEIKCKDDQHQFAAYGQSMSQAVERWNNIVGRAEEAHEKKEDETRKQMRQAASDLRVYIDEMTAQGIPEDKAWKLILTLIKAGQ